MHHDLGGVWMGKLLQHRRGAKLGAEVAVLVAVCLVSGATAPATAATSTITGSIVIQGTAILDNYPCPGSCPGSFQASESAVLTGIALNGAAYTAVWPLSSVATGLTHGEPCANPPSPLPLSGWASTQLSLTNGAFLSGGINPAKFTGAVTWTMHGTVGEMVVTGEVSGNGGAAVAYGTLDQGVVTFAPTGLPVICGSPTGTLALGMTGVDLQAF